MTLGELRNRLNNMAHTDPELLRLDCVSLWGEPCNYLPGEYLAVVSNDSIITALASNSHQEVSPCQQ